MDHTIPTPKTSRTNNPAQFDSELAQALGSMENLSTGDTVQVDNITVHIVQHPTDFTECMSEALCTGLVEADDDMFATPLATPASTPKLTRTINAVGFRTVFTLKGRLQGKLFHQALIKHFGEPEWVGLEYA